jgi:predicted transcriptional regulator of viral defense system
MQKQEQLTRVLKLVKKHGILRPRDLDAHGIPREYLRQLHDLGKLERTGRGLYVLSNSDVTENHSFAQAAKRVPIGVISLLSALRFHELTTQLPFEVWMTIEVKAWTPKVDNPRMRFTRASGRAFTGGVETHKIEGVSVKIYDPGKTVADCFKYRNKVGLDVAIEALRDCISQRKSTMDQLWKYAGICRVSNIMRPYMEAMG